MWNNINNSIRSLTEVHSLTDDDGDGNVVTWAEKVQERFEMKVGIKPSMGWLKAYHHHYHTANSSSTTTTRNNNYSKNNQKWKEEDAVLQEILDSDLRTVLRSMGSNWISHSGEELQHACNITCNQRTPPSQHKMVTSSNFKCMVQLEEIMDVSKPLESRYILHPDNNNNNNNSNNNNTNRNYNNYQNNRNHKSCWKMVLCHGNWVKKEDVQIVAMMTSSDVFSSSTIRAGMKLLLHSSITISRGVCELHAGNTIALGGYVLELHQKQEKIQQYYQQRAHMDSTIRALLPTSLTDNNDNEENDEPQDEHVGSSSSTQIPTPTTTTTNQSTNSSSRITTNVTQHFNNDNSNQNTSNTNNNNQQMVPSTNHVTTSSDGRNNNIQISYNNQEFSTTSINRQYGQTSKSFNSHPKNKYRNATTALSQPQPIEILDDDDNNAVDVLEDNINNNSTGNNTNMIASNNQNLHDNNTASTMQEKILPRSHILNPYQQNSSSNRQSNNGHNGNIRNRVHNPYSSNKAATVQPSNNQKYHTDNKTSNNNTNTTRNNNQLSTPPKNIMHQKQTLLTNANEINQISHNDGTIQDTISHNSSSQNEENPKTTQSKVTTLKFDEFRKLLIKLTKMTSSQALEYYSEMASSQTFLVPCRVKGKPLDFDIVKNKRAKKKHSKLKKTPLINTKHEKYNYFMIVKLAGSNLDDGTITCQISHDVLLPFLKVPPAELRHISRADKAKANKITTEGGLKLIHTMSNTVLCHLKLHLSPQEFYSCPSNQPSDSIGKAIEVNGYNPIVMMLSIDKVKDID